MLQHPLRPALSGAGQHPRRSRLAVVSACAEPDAAPAYHLEAVVTGFERCAAPPGGSPATGLRPPPAPGLLSLLLTTPGDGEPTGAAPPACAFVPPSSRQLLLPLGGPLAGALEAAIASRGLPAPLSSVPDLHLHDIRLLFADSAEDGAFFLQLLAGGGEDVAMRLASPLAAVLGQAVRHQTPVLFAEGALLGLAAAAAAAEAGADVETGGGGCGGGSTGSTAQERAELRAALGAREPLLPVLAALGRRHAARAAAGAGA